MIDKLQIASESMKAWKTNAVKNMKPGGMSVGIPGNVPKAVAGGMGVAVGAGYLGMIAIQNAKEKLERSWQETDASIGQGVQLHNQWLQQQQAKKKIGPDYEQFNKDWYKEMGDQANTPDDESNYVFDILDKIDNKLSKDGLNRFATDAQLAFKRHVELGKIAGDVGDKLYGLKKYFEIKEVK